MSDQPRGISGMAIADTPKARYLIHDDEPAAAPSVFDTRTCQEKHSAMQAYQAQRLDELWVAFTDARLRIANLERIITDLQTQHVALAAKIENG